MTVTVAYDRLAGEGFVSSRVGSGTFVTEHVSPPRGESRRRQPDGAVQPRPVWNSVPLSRAFARRAQFDFRIGLPDASLFPHDKWRRLVSGALRSEAMGPVVYGEPAGYGPLREAIARHIGVARGMEIAAEDVTIVNGAQQGLDVVARTLLAPGDRVALEDPGYRMVRWLFESMGTRIRYVPVDQNGLVFDALPRRAQLVYVTPSHQYGLGVSMSFERRRALLQWAERNHAAIIEDDYGSEFRFRDRPIEPLQTLDANGRVIYISSFSKTMLPTIRLGFIVTPASLRAAVHRAKQVTDWHTPMPLQVALAQFIESGEFSRHVRKMREVYHARREIVIETLTRQFGDYLEVVPSIAAFISRHSRAKFRLRRSKASLRRHRKPVWRFRSWQHLVLLHPAAPASCWGTGRFPPPTSGKGYVGSGVALALWVPAFPRREAPQQGRSSGIVQHVVIGSGQIPLPRLQLP